MPRSSLALMLLLGATVGSGAQAYAPQRGAFVELGETVEPPQGFTDMCSRSLELCNIGKTAQRMPAAAPISCGASGGSFAAASLGWVLAAQFACTEIMAMAATVADPVVGPVAGPLDRKSAVAELRLLRRINSDVNRTTVQVDDVVAFGVDERWSRLPQSYSAGDCEDMAIEKRARLVAAGFPTERLFLATAYKRGFGLHTVLMARTFDGDLVLDSLEPRPRPWTKARYSWLRIQTPGEPLTWRRLRTPAAALTDATTATQAAGRTTGTLAIAGG